MQKARAGEEEADRDHVFDSVLAHLKEGEREGGREGRKVGVRQEPARRRQTEITSLTAFMSIRLKAGRREGGRKGKREGGRRREGFLRVKDY